MTLDRSIVKLDSERLHLLLQSTLEQQWNVMIPVAGNSMRPLWKHKRDSVMLKKCDPYTLRKRDVVLYRRRSGQIVLHRIVKVNRDSFDLCGDAQVDIERGLPKQYVLAVMIGFSRNERQYSYKHPLYIVYSHIWSWLRPARRAATVGIRTWRWLIS